MVTTRRIFVLALALLVITAASAHAQNIANLTTQNAHGMDTVLATLKAVVGQWGQPLTAIAEDLFGIIALISFVLEVGFALASGAAEGLQAILAVLLRQMVVLGTWLWVVENWSTGMRFGNAILASFQEAGTRAGGIPNSPGNIFELGLGFASRLMHETSVLGTIEDPGRSMGLYFTAIVIVLLFAGIAAIVFLTVGKAVVTLAIGQLALAFSASSLTRSVAWNALWHALGSGARILAQLLLVSIGVQVLQASFGTGTGPLGSDDGFAILGIALVLAVLAYGVPAGVEHLFHGSGHGNASLSHAVRSLNQTMSTMSTGGGMLAQAGGSMLSSLQSGDGSLQGLPGLGGSGGMSGGGSGAAGSSRSSGTGGGFAGSGFGGRSSSGQGASGRMQPSGARYKRS